MFLDRLIQIRFFKFHHGKNLSGKEFYRIKYRLFERFLQFGRKRNPNSWCGSWGKLWELVYLPLLEYTRRLRNISTKISFYLPYSRYICHSVKNDKFPTPKPSQKLANTPNLESSLSHQPQTAPKSRRSLECYFPQPHEFPESL